MKYNIINRKIKAKGRYKRDLSLYSFMCKTISSSTANVSKRDAIPANTPFSIYPFSAKIN